MNKHALNRKEQINLLILEFFGFAFVFTFLGGLIFYVFNSGIYSNSDNTLKQQVSILNSVNTQPKANDSSSSSSSANQTSNLNQGRPPIQAIGGVDVLYLNDQNEIVNSGILGGHLSAFSSIDFSNYSLESIKTITIGDDTYRFIVTNLKNTLTIDGQSATKAVAISNFNSEVASIRSFQSILVIALIAGIIWVLVISWWVSQRLMRPILNSWQQQQDFVDSAAHELRTPLTIIQNKMEDLLRRPKERVADISENIVSTLSEVRRLNQLTSDMLTLAKSGSNMTKLDPQEVDIPSKINEILDPYIEVAKSESKKINVELDGKFQKMSMDVKRLHQLIVILLDNSLKYTSEGDEIVFNASMNKNMLKFSVANNGPSLDNDVKKKIFDRFYRAEKSGNRETGGSGLGLSIAQWIVSAYKGSIKVDDWHKTSPKGVIFLVELPEIKK